MLYFVLRCAVHPYSQLDSKVLATLVLTYLLTASDILKSDCPVDWAVAENTSKLACYFIPHLNDAYFSFEGGSIEIIVAFIIAP